MTVYESQYELLECMPSEVAEWGWQDEICPDTGRKHRQGYVRTQFQMTRVKLSKLLPGIHLEVAKDWDALKEYCRKVESRDLSGTQIEMKNPRRLLKFHEALENVARASKDFLSTLEVSV